MRTFNEEMCNYLKLNAKYHTIKELVKIVKTQFNEDFSNKELAHYCIRKNIKYKYEKPKKAHTNKSTPIGTEVIKTDGNMVKVKTKEHKWEYKQRLIYENYYNVKLPKDVYVIFLDQDKNNFDINNLKAISRRESAIMARYGLFSDNKRVTKLGNTTSKLIIKTKVN